MTAWTKRLGIVAAVIVLGFVAGCAGHPAEPIPPAETSDAVNCLSAEQGGPAAGRVPEGFDPVAVYRCNIHATVDDAEGRWSAVEIERLSGDFGPLLRALEEPDDAPNGNPCPAMAELVRELWLADASGQAIHVHYPRTSCGFTKPAVNAALDLLTVVNTTTEKVQLMESRAAMDAGCATLGSPLTLVTGSLPNDVAVDGGIPGDSGATSVPGSPRLAPSAAEIDYLRVCRYERDTTARAGQAFLEGKFVGAGELRGDQVRLVLAATAEGGASADTCSTEATRFAMSLPVRDGVVVGAAITVELDGCRRISSPTTPARPATEEVLRLVS